MFEMKVDPSKKAFIIKVGGFFREDEAMNFLETYNKHVQSINPSDYTLILLSEDLAVSNQDMLPKLEGIINLYKSAGFKKFYSTYPKSVVAKIQLEKISQKCNFNVSFEQTMEDIYKKLG